MTDYLKLIARLECTHHQSMFSGVAEDAVAAIREQAGEIETTRESLHDACVLMNNARAERDEWRNNYQILLDDSVSLRDELGLKVRELKRVSSSHDKLIERSVGAMAIANGDEGYEKVPLDCPMLKSVSDLRAAHASQATEIRLLQKAHYDCRDHNEGMRAEVAALRKALNETADYLSGEFYSEALGVLDDALADKQAQP